MNNIRKALTNSIISNKVLFTYFLLLRYYLNNTNSKKKRHKNIVMLHAGRTGSSVIADMLSQHTNIKWNGEIYLDYPKYLTFFTSDPIQFLIYKMYQKHSKIYGFELKALKNQHLEMFIKLSLEEYLEEITNLGYSYFIFLKRKNLLRRYISIIQMLETNVYHTTKNPVKPRIITINTKNIWINNQKTDLINYFKILEKEYDDVQKIIKKYNFLYLSYEEDVLANPSIAYKKICKYINVEIQNPKVNLKRTNPFSIKEVVANYEEIEMELRNTDYYWMLES